MADSGNEEPNEEQNVEDEKLFYVERAKTGRSKCKKCKNVIDSGNLRLAKMIINPFGTGKMKIWHHLHCIFEVFKRQRATTPKIEKIEDMGGYETLSSEDIEEILKYLSDDARSQWDILRKEMLDNPPSSTQPSKKRRKTENEASLLSTNPDILSPKTDPKHRDNSLRQFRKICMSLSNESSYLQKTNVLKEFFEKGSDGVSFKGDLLLWCRLLLPGAVKTIYNLQSKQLVKIFSRVFETDIDDMLTHLEDGDVSLTVSEFFQKSNVLKPTNKSILTLHEVNDYLQQLSKLTKEEDQQKLLTEISKRCTVNDLQIFIRFIKHDLRINAGPKHILNALHPDAFQAFKTCRDIDNVIKDIIQKQSNKKSLNIGIKLLTPVLPMLAEACSSMGAVIKKYPEGLYAEIKYDGERVQLHKQGSDFKYFSRSLKPVLSHKVNHFKDYIEKAFPTGDDLILDCEVLMIDMSTGNPLPFGTLGIHKKNEFKDANPCLFVFDCLFYNGKSLLTCSLQDRRQVLQKNMIEIPNHVKFSEIKLIKSLKDLESMLMVVLDKGLEGLVLKDISGIYEPGKRRWVKVKRDYLFEGRAADTVDLVVLGAWYGTGHKGGMMNVFLMGCYNPLDKTWRSVTKVHGHDDETLKALQTELQMVKISRDVTKVPKWLQVTKTMIPDFVARDPKNMPIWEICGHEFTKHDVHTANGISIRFPRVAKVRHDKTWKTATTLSELQYLYEVSKTNPSSRILPFLDWNSGSDPQTTPSPAKRARKELTAEESDLGSDSSPEKRKRKIKILEKENKDIPKPRKTLPDQPLPDILAGKRIKVKYSAADLEFRRHFIAYGATVVKEDTENPTHEIVPDSFSVIVNDKDERILRLQLCRVNE